MNTVTITVSIPGASAAELDITTATAIANEAKEHCLRSLGSKNYTATVTAATA